MKQDIQFKLQAYLDGELPSAEAKVVSDLVASDSQARELLTELSNTRAAIADHEADVKLPCSRDFYWSGIRREIERQEKSVVVKSGEISLLTMLKRMMVPASGLVAVMLAVMLAGQSFRSAGNVVREESETTFTDAGAFTYRDYASGTTLVWVDYPAEKDFSEMDPDDIFEID